MQGTAKELHHEGCMVVQIFFSSGLLLLFVPKAGQRLSMFYARVKNGQARITVTARLLGVVRTCVDKRSSIGGALLRRSASRRLRLSAFALALSHRIQTANLHLDLNGYF